MNKFPAMIIDNFYDDPDSVRDYALGLDYTLRKDLEKHPNTYPGGRSNHLHELDPVRFDQFGKKIFSALYNFGYDVVEWNLTCRFQKVNSHYNHGWAHRDEGVLLAGVVYLTPDAPLESGTSLYKENDKFNYDMYLMANQAKEQYFSTGIMPPDYKDLMYEYHQMFDETIRVNNVYNRMVMYEGELFHGANNYFGEDEDCRLVQLFYVNSVKAPSYPVERVRDYK